MTTSTLWSFWWLDDEGDEGDDIDGDDVYEGDDGDDGDDDDYGDDGDDGDEDGDVVNKEKNAHCWQVSNTGSNINCFRINLGVIVMVIVGNIITMVIINMLNCSTSQSEHLSKRSLK